MIATLKAIGLVDVAEAAFVLISMALSVEAFSVAASIIRSVSP